MQVEENPQTITVVRDAERFLLALYSKWEFVIVQYGSIYLKLTAVINSLCEPQLRVTALSNIPSDEEMGAENQLRLSIETCDHDFFRNPAIPFCGVCSAPNISPYNRRRV